MKKIIVASLTLAFAGAAQSAVLLEKVVERNYADMSSIGDKNSPAYENLNGIERTLKKICSIQDDAKMVIQYQAGDLISKVTYPISIDKVLIPKKIASVVSEVQINGNSPYPFTGYISSGTTPVGNTFYYAYNKKTKVPLLIYEIDSIGITSSNPYKANSETATNLKNLIDLTCDNLPMTVTDSITR